MPISVPEQFDMLDRLRELHSRGLMRLFRALGAVVASMAMLAALSSHAQSPGALPSDPRAAAGSPSINTGPIRLSSPVPENDLRQTSSQPSTTSQVSRPAQQGEFEAYVSATEGNKDSVVRRFGSSLLENYGDIKAPDLTAGIPADYLVAVGDEVEVTIWGSVEADLRLVVDRNGSISIPRVGTVRVAGVRQAELTETIARRVSQVFKNYQISVNLGRLRPIRVFATGFVAKPGVYTVGSLSTVLSVLLHAGGPAASGSFRSIELRRQSQVVMALDLYDLLLRGDRTADRLVQAGDVIHVGPVGVEVGVIGSVNNPTIVELKSGETVELALAAAGGFSAIADRTRLALERFSERNSGKVAELQIPSGLATPLQHGDVLRAFSGVNVALPEQNQSKRVFVEGEVVRPAEYVLPAGSSISDAIRMAGGVTANAFVFATEFRRESVKITQQQNYERALRDLEVESSRIAASRGSSSVSDAASEAARNSNTMRLLDRLRQIKPTGRIVLQLKPESAELPDLLLETGDRIYIPPKPTTVGVFGSVFNAANYLFVEGRSTDQYLQLAGGPTKNADYQSAFIIRANGNVISNRQGSRSWLDRKNLIERTVALPGDTIFVPEELDKTTFVQMAKDWTQIFYQFGLGAAGIVALGR